MLLVRPGGHPACAGGARVNRSTTTTRLLCHVIIRQEEKCRRQGVAAGGSGGGVISGTGGGGNSGAGRGNVGTHGAETPSNLASITPTAREATRGVTARQRFSHRTYDVRNNSGSNNNNNCSKENLLLETGDDCEPTLTPRCQIESLKSHHYHQHHHHHHYNQQQQQHQVRMISDNNILSGTVNNILAEGGGLCGEVTAYDKYKGTGTENRVNSDTNQGHQRQSDRSMLKIEKLAGKSGLHGGETTVVGNKCVAERMKSQIQEQSSYNKHEISGKSKGHDIGHGYKVENLRYYGELKGYGDFKAYGIIDKQQSVLMSSHEKSHLLHVPTGEKNDRCHVKVSSSSSAIMQGYVLAKTSQQPEKSSHHVDHYYHRSSHSKPSAYQVYQETKYSYNVSGLPGTPAQASAAAAFFARSVPLN